MPVASIATLPLLSPLSSVTFAMFECVLTSARWARRSYRRRKRPWLRFRRALMPWRDHMVFLGDQLVHFMQLFGFLLHDVL